jgi:alpha-L-fucosidase
MMNTQNFEKTFITMKPGSEPNEVQREQIKRKFGMFIHFGINTFSNLEWSKFICAI